jgi:aminopeptidase N
VNAWRPLREIPVLAFLAAAGVAPAAAPQPQTQDVLAYRVTLEPDFARRWVVGHEQIVFDPRSLASGELVFTASALTIRDARIDGVSVEPRVEGAELRIPVPRARARARRATLDVSFDGAPARGYELRDGVLVTSYFACDWMLCAQEAFGDKATIRLDLILPRTMTTVGPGTLVEARALADGKVRARWESTSAYSAYLYAFAAGELRPSTPGSMNADKGRVELRLISALPADAKLEALFAPTREMLIFFEGLAGTPFPRKDYTQLLVDGTAAQEQVSHSIIGRAAVEPMLKDPSEDWAIAHELAHQWWGNSITCTTLSEFWLNEGVTTFVVAAWKEHRWGRAAYERELDIARRRLAAAGEEWRDVRLTFDGKYPSLAVRRAIQYSKGALFLDALRTELGDELFWKGFRQYTRDNLGRSVTSSDFERAFERVSGRDLSGIFGAWVR